ncbi:MAG: ATP-dependent RecD-like DNA helicase, partial [Actinomycetota bacterium]
ALRPETYVVLVGDPGQLASVENGSILWDLARLEDRFGDLITRLEISHRNQQTVSSTFTDAVRDANRDEVERILSSAPGPEEKTFSFIEVENGLRKTNKKRFGTIVDRFTPVREAAIAGDVDTALAAAAAIRIVCAHRRGAFGVEEWNNLIREELFDDSTTWTPGQIVIKTRNDPANGLANGDTGIVVSSGEIAEATLEFAFARGNDPLRKPTAAVDDIELAFATTVHKAQGSEFGTVIVIVPPKSSPLCTRELLYTAATRAKPNLILIGHREDVLYAVETERPRFSGLVDRLRAGLG